MKIRQPIITVAGHVDHGKTSILDKIRCSSVAECEAGGITQKISSTIMPKETIQQRAGNILEKFKIPIEIPGFLFIDTPGHAAFTNLRKRGGSLADIAILVIDINDGIKPQTAEVLQILKANKTPFIVALNKIDNISGWKTSQSLLSYESVEHQAINVKENFDEKYYTIVGALNTHGFNPELYYKIEDFTKNLAIIPCSAKTGEGISELLAMLVALSQKFLKQRIELKNKDGKGVIIETKKEKSINYLDCILYDGGLDIKDEIVIASLDKPILSRIRSLEQAKPLSKGYQSAKTVQAAAGIRIQITSKEEILPGMPFQVVKDQTQIEKIEKEFKKEISEEIKTDKSGIIIKAESLGSLEALLFLLKQKQIKVIKVGIGDINKKDLYQANASPEEDKVILGFNVSLDEESEEEAHKLKNIKIISNPVVYKIIEDYERWKQEKLQEIERQKLGELNSIFKLNVLDFVFRNSNPAIFGVKIESGKLKPETQVINSSNEKIGRIKGIQEDKSSVKQAESGKEVAISIPGVNFERQLKIGENLYSDLSESQFRKFKEHKYLLTRDEVKTLQEISQIKRAQNITWGV